MRSSSTVSGWARIEGSVAALLTRNGLDWTAKYPRIANALASLPCQTAYLDGEHCAVDADGVTSFSADPEGSRSSIGSLLLGYYRDDGKLIYAATSAGGETGLTCA